MDDNIFLEEDDALVDDFYDQIIRRRNIARRTNWRHRSTSDYNESGNDSRHIFQKMTWRSRFSPYCQITENDHLLSVLAYLLLS